MQDGSGPCRRSRAECYAKWFGGWLEKTIFCEDSESGVRMPLISVVGDQGQNVMHSGICCEYAGSMREHADGTPQPSDMR